MSVASQKKISRKFQDFFGCIPDVAAYAPGRIEVLGNHTDHNEGIVLSCATDSFTYFAAKIVDEEMCSIHSFDINKTAEFSIFKLEEKVSGQWGNYIKGVCFELSKLGNVRAFNAGICSEVPLSAGISSSAALVVSSSFALGKLFDIKLDKKEWAKLGQRVENSYIGVKSGLLDQFTSIYGKKNNLILCDFRRIDVIDKVNFPPDYVFVIVNSMVKHTLVESDYNLRRESCERAVESIKQKYPKIKALRDVSLAMLENTKRILDFTDYKRAFHIVLENDLVLKGMQALRNGDIELFGSYLYASHDSSRRNFENSCPELDYLIELSKSIPGCVGARLSGGGFGGASIHLVKKEEADRYRARIATAFKLQTNIDPQTIVCSAANGAGIFSKVL